jgi:hypothetical protein
MPNDNDMIFVIFSFELIHVVQKVIYVLNGLHYLGVHILSKYRHIAEDL